MTAPDSVFRLDHLAIAARTLDEGVAWAEARLGCPLAPGGAHSAMGTHNRLLSLGADLYLEVIAIDPAAEAPRRPRWFGLDGFSLQPRLQAWILAVDDIAQAPASSGRPLALERGTLRWQMAVPEDGVLPFDGMHPAVIAWQGADHPTRHLPDRGLRLDTLTVSHPEAEALAALCPGLDDPRVVFAPGAPGLRARLTSPAGEVLL